MGEKYKLIDLYKKTNSKFQFLFLSVIILESKWIWQLIIMKAFTIRVSLPAQYAITCLCYIAFVIVISLYFSNNNNEAKDEKPHKRFINAAFAILITAAIMTVAGYMLSLWSFFLPLLVEAGTFARILFALLFFVSFVLSQVVFIAGYVLFISILKNDTADPVFSTFTITVKRLLLHKTKAIILLFSVSVLSFLLFKLKGPADVFVDYFLGAGFIGMFFKYMMQSFIAALLLSIINTVLESFGKTEVSKKASPEKNRLTLVVTSIICVVIVLSNLFLYGIHKSEVEKLIKEADFHVEMGDVYRYADLFTHSKNRYDNAKYLLAGAEALLEGVNEIKSKGSTVNTRQLFAKADSSLPENGTTDYFKALLSMKKDEYVDFLLKNHIYQDSFYPVLNYSQGKIDRLLDEIRSREQELEKRELYVLLDSMWYDEYKNAFNKLEKQIAAYEKKYGEYVSDYHFYLNVAMLADMCNTSNYNHKAISEYIMRYYELFDTGTKEEEITKSLNTVHFLVASNDFEKAGNIIAKAIKTYPNERSLIEKKAEILFRSEKYENLKAFLNEEVNVGRPNPLLYMFDSLVKIKDKDYKEAVASINKAIDITDDKTIDLYIHNFCIEYVDNTKRDFDEIFEVSGIDQNPLLYNTLKGAILWRQKNYEEAQPYYMKARDISGYPAYLNYFLGMNSYEYANQASDPDFNEAEDYYLKAIEMDSTNPHFFFSIGYCYKKMGDIEKSTAAFNKVLSILPYQDYNKDYYGISGHSKTNLRKAGANK